jgi:hypothetical protein
MIPTLSGWAMLLLSSLLLIAPMGRLRRRPLARRSPLEGSGSD